MISFIHDGIHYQVKSEKLKRFHDIKGGQTFFYAYKNGKYVEGTTSISEKESLEMLLKLENINPLFETTFAP